MPISQPQSNANPRIKLTFEFGQLAGKDFGYLFHSFEFRGMVNGGYIVRAKLFDAGYNLLTKLISEGYFKESRTRAIKVHFQILAGSEGEYPKSATKPQTAIVMSLDVVGGPADVGYIELIAIDPPSWYLNLGDAAGDCFVGRIDQVIRKVVAEYAPEISLEVGKTTDSEFNRWWMMRQDPKTFLSNLIEWSAGITQRRTQWVIQMNGNQLVIKEQASIPSKQRAFYRYFGQADLDTINKVNLKANNALSIAQAAIVTAGSAAISGRYLDRTTDVTRNKVYTNDDNTQNKQIAKITDDQSFAKPSKTIGKAAGWSFINAVPEIYSAGDLGLLYDDYLDGRSRNMWLHMTNALLRAKFKVLGHGEWSSTDGLGVDTIFVKWMAAKTDDDENNFWWATGNWLVYGFHHYVTRGGWYTDLYCSRFDHDANAKKVGGAIDIIPTAVFI